MNAHQAKRRSSYAPTERREDLTAYRCASLDRGITATGWMCLGVLAVVAAFWVAVICWAVWG